MKNVLTNYSHIDSYEKEVTERTRDTFFTSDASLCIVRLVRTTIVTDYCSISVLDF
jgi:hypothetical protein